MARAKTLTKLRRADEKYRSARDERRTLMVGAVDEGVPVTEVAEAAGVTRDAVYKLVQASRRDGR